MLNVAVRMLTSYRAQYVSVVTANLFVKLKFIK